MSSCWIPWRFLLTTALLVAVVMSLVRLWYGGGANRTEAVSKLAGALTGLVLLQLFIAH